MKHVVDAARTHALERRPTRRRWKEGWEKEAQRIASVAPLHRSPQCCFRETVRVCVRVCVCVCVRVSIAVAARGLAVEAHKREERQHWPTDEAMTERRV